MYDIKAIYEAKSVEHAVQLRMEHPEAVIIAGGSDVLIKIREGRLAGCELISIYGLDEMRGISAYGAQIGLDVVQEVSAKIDALRIPRGISVRAALVYDGELSPAVGASGFFDAIVPASRLLGLD